MSDKPDDRKALSNLAIVGKDHNDFMKKADEFFAEQSKERPEEFSLLGSSKDGFKLEELRQIDKDKVDAHTKIFVLAHGGMRDEGSGAKHYIRLNETEKVNTNDLVTSVSAISDAPKQIYFTSCYSGVVTKMVDSLAPGSMIMSFSTPDSLAHNPFSQSFFDKLAEKPDEPITELIVSNFGSLAARGAFVGIKPKTGAQGAGLGASGGSSADASSAPDLIFFENYLSLDSLLATDEPIHIAVSKRLKEILDAMPDDAVPQKPSLKQIQKFLTDKRKDLGSSSTFLDHNMKEITRRGVDHYLEREMDFKGKDPRLNLRGFSPKIIKDIDATTPIIYQTIQHYKETKQGGAETLVRDIIENVAAKGADINGQGKEGNTALLHAAKSCPTRMVDFLLSKGANFKHRNKDEQSALHLAAIGGNKENVEKFLSLGLRINSKDKLGNTPLHYAIKEKKFDVVQALLAKGADVKLKNKDKQSMLHLAAMSGNKDLVEELIKSGLHINAKDKDGNTALHYAIREKKEDVVQALIAHGADPKIKNKDGKSAILSCIGVYGYDHNGALKRALDYFIEHSESKPHDFSVVGSLGEDGLKLQDLETKHKGRIDAHTKIFIDLHGSNVKKDDKKVHHVVLGKGARVQTSSLIESIATLSDTPKQIYIATCYGGDVPKMVDKLQAGSMIVSLSSKDTITYDPYSPKFKKQLGENPDIPITDLMIENFGWLASNGAFIGIKRKTARGGAGAPAAEGTSADKGGQSDVLFLENYLSLDSLLEDDRPLRFVVAERLASIFSEIPDELVPYKPDANEIAARLVNPALSTKTEIVSDGGVIESKGSSVVDMGAGISEVAIKTNLLHENMRDMIHGGIVHYITRAVEYGQSDHTQDPQKNLKDFSASTIKMIDEIEPIVNVCCAHFKNNPIIVANIIRDVVAKGADPNAKDKSGYPEIINAIYKKQDDLCDLLLEIGADIEASDPNGHTALHYAVFGDNIDITKKLIDKGANLNLQDKNGMTPLHYAIKHTSKNHKYEIVDLLLAKGADPTLRDKDGKTALEYIYNSPAGIHDVCGPSMETSISEAIRNGRYEIAKALIKLGVDVNKPDVNDVTPLHFAVQMGSVVIDSLLEKGADINAQDKNGKTPLMHKISLASADLKKILDNPTLDVFVQDKDGKTILELYSTTQRK